MQLTTVKSIGIVQKVSHTFAFVWILVNGSFACRPEFKNISEDVTLSCSHLPIAEPIVWLFNNHSQVNSSFYRSRPHGTLVISSHDVAVYGDYSCKFENDTLINCFSLYIQGDCSDGCGTLTINGNTTDFYQNSNITFYSTVKANLLAPAADDELGFFIFLKDSDHINNSNRTNHSVITSPNITFYIFNAQFSDSGVYQFKFISSHAELYTNRLSIEINPSSTTTKSITPTSTSVHVTYTMQTTPTPTTDTGQQSPNSTSNKLIGPIVGGVIGAVILLVVVIGMIIAWRQRCCHKSPHPTPVQNTDEIAITDQTVNLQRVLTVDSIPTGQANEQEHAQFS